MGYYYYCDASFNLLYVLKNLKHSILLNSVQKGYPFLPGFSVHQEKCNHNNIRFYYLGQFKGDKPWSDLQRFVVISNALIYSIKTHLLMKTFEQP